MHCLNPEQKPRIAKIRRCSWVHQTQTKPIPEEPCHLALLLTCIHGAHSIATSTSPEEHRGREAVGNPNLNSLERTSHTGPLQVCPREGSGIQGQLPSRQNLCSTAGGIYILEGMYIYSHWWPCPTQQEKNWSSLCSWMCFTSLCWSVGLTLFTCVNISVCLCPHLLGAHAQASSGWTSPGLLDPVLNTTIHHHLPAVRCIPYFIETVLHSPNEWFFPQQKLAQIIRCATSASALFLLPGVKAT